MDDPFDRQHPPRKVRPHLEHREQEAFLNWLRHDTKRAAARQMYVTESTISTHMQRIRRKYAEVGRPAPTKAACSPEPFRTD